MGSHRAGMSTKDRYSFGDQPVNIAPEEEIAPGCFDFRTRTRSFDLHQLAQHQKLRKLGLLFRHGSETDTKASPHSIAFESSSKNSTTLSPGDRRRRFVRVLRDAHNPDLENPHVVHRFSQDYVENLYIERSNSISEGVKPLPYVVTGHTILKKQSTTIDKFELGQSESPSGNKHAKFFDEVIVIEFDKKCTVNGDSHVTREKLHDDSTDGSMEVEAKEKLVVLEMIVPPEMCSDDSKMTRNGNDLDNEVFLANGVC